MYNSYLNNNQFGSQYYPNYTQPYGSYQNTQITQRQMPMQPQQVTGVQDVPFNDIKFVTADEAKAYIVAPNTKVMLMDRDKSIFYIKSADSLGKSTLEGFKYSKLNENPIDTISTEFDPKEFVKTSDLKSFITRDEMNGFLTKEDLNGIATEIDKLKKRIEINEVAKGDIRNGK